MRQTRPKEDVMVQYEMRDSSRCYAMAITITLILITLISSSHCKLDEDVEWREGYEGHGTVHEQMGQPHWPEPDYSPYVNKYKFTVAPKYYNFRMDWFFNLTHYLFQNILDSDPPLPLNYIAFQNGDTLSLGPKVYPNDWKDLLMEYWLIFAFVGMLSILIFVMPFIAVCYCCFCCCRRCGQYCPPCDHAIDARRRMICTLLMILLIILIFLGLLYAVTSYKLFIRGISQEKDLVLRGNMDTCAFMKNTSEHMRHLMITNFQELYDHIKFLIEHSSSHIFFDLGDSSEANSLEELERILDNLPEAMQLMEQVESHEKELHFNNDNLRDIYRSVKRELHYQLGVTKRFLDSVFYPMLNSRYNYMGLRGCSHLDELPQAKFYVKGFKETIKAELSAIPKQGLKKFNEINDKVKHAVTAATPALLDGLETARGAFMLESKVIDEVLDKTISAIHLKTKRMFKSFDDVYEKYGTEGETVHFFTFASIIIILILLIGALITGFCVNTKAGANCFLIAIIMMFSAFSAIILVALFYFLIGLLTYSGGCAPIKGGGTGSRLINQLMETAFVEEHHGANEELTEELKNALRNCEAEESIFEYLRESKIYNVNELDRFDSLSDEDVEVPEVNEDLASVILFTKEQKDKITVAIGGNLSTYHGDHFRNELCNNLHYYSLKNMPATLDSFVRNLEYPYWKWKYGHWEIDYWNDPYEQIRKSFTARAKILRSADAYFIPRMQSDKQAIRQKVDKIDKLILYNNYDFGTSLQVLLGAVVRAEEFIKSRGEDFLQSIIKNLTEDIQQQYFQYVDRVITQSNTRVGLCEPLAYIYFRGMQDVCERLVNPINGYWAGKLIAGLLLMPLLVVTHRLMCLFKRYVPIPPVSDDVQNICPICTGGPAAVPPIIVCGGGQKDNCVCSSKARNTGGTVDHNLMSVSEQLWSIKCEGEDEEVTGSINKRKKE